MPFCLAEKTQGDNQMTLSHQALWGVVIIEAMLNNGFHGHMVDSRFQESGEVSVKRVFLISAPS